MGNPQEKWRTSKRPFAFMRWASLLLAGGCIAMLYFQLGHYTEADQAAYEKLTNKDDTQDLLELKTSKQQRTGIQKNILVDHDRHLQLKSATSELSLEKRGRHVEVVEHLHDVTCRIQDDLNLTVLHAAEATYHYQDGHLSAEDVHAVHGSISAQTPSEIPHNEENQEPLLAVSSDHVHYHQGLMTLSGHATVEHSQGALSADKIVIPELDKSKHRIEQMTAEGAVKIRYEDKLTVNADYAVFKHHPDVEDNFSGIITLTGNAGQSCLVSTPGDDEMRAPQIAIDTQKRELHFTSPKGILRSVSETAKPVYFDADYMVWHDISSKLRLIGNVEIIQEGCCFNATRDVLLVLTTIEGKRVLRGIETKGEAILTYQDSTPSVMSQFLAKEDSKNLSHLLQNEYILHSYGSLKIDHQKQEIKLRSPEMPDGNVIKEKQVHLKDSKGEIYADRAFLKYDDIGQKMVPVRIVFQGNVKMNTLPSQKAGSQHYVLADRADLMPQSKEVVLKANKGNRVLLFDPSSNLEVSAPGIRFNRDHTMAKETIQGIGDVRFHFVDAECDELQRHFSLYEKIGTSKK